MAKRHGDTMQGTGRYTDIIQVAERYRCTMQISE